MGNTKMLIYFRHRFDCVLEFNVIYLSFDFVEFVIYFIKRLFYSKNFGFVLLSKKNNIIGK